MSEPFRAFHVPRGVTVRDLDLLEGRFLCLYPSPDPGLLTEAVATARKAGRRLADRPVMDLVPVIDAAAATLADAAHPAGDVARRLVAAATGYSMPMTDMVITRMVADWRSRPLEDLLQAELGEPSVLDRFVPAGPDRWVRAYGPDLSFHVFSGNVPGVAVTSLVRSLLVKAPALAKLASDEPVLPVLFARALARQDPELGDCLVITYWPGGREAVEAVAMAEADTVVVYGGGPAVESLQRRAPTGRRLVVHGPMFSTGLIAADALGGDLSRLARDVARAVATFDQQGCVSPHSVWVEDPGGALAEPFSAALASAMEEVEQELPRGDLTPGEAYLIQQQRSIAELSGHAAGGRVMASAGTHWTVVLDPEPAFRPSCLNRFVRVHPVPDLDRALRALAPHGDQIQSVAIEAPADRRLELAHRVARLGASRITTFSRIAWPPPNWHHDGSSPLRELLRWVDLEE